MPRNTPLAPQDSRRRAPNHAQPAQPRRPALLNEGGLLNDELLQDLEMYPGPQQEQQQEELQQQQQQQLGQVEQGPAAEDEVQIVDPTEEVRNWK